MPKEYNRQPLWDPNSAPGSSQGEGFQQPGAKPASNQTFTEQEIGQLYLLRNRYQKVQDTFSEEEIQRLDFIRFLRAQGKTSS